MGRLELKLRHSLFMMHELRVQYKMRGSPQGDRILSCSSYHREQVVLIQTT